MEAENAPKRRGRPPGTRNKPALARPHELEHSDPDTIVGRQLTMLDWAQQAIRNDMQRMMEAPGGVHAGAIDMKQLESLSNAIVRAVEALKKSSDLADELAKRLTPEQLLEAALKKIEAQDVVTLNTAIKRLRAYREKLAPVTGNDRRAMGEPPTPGSAIASLEDE